MFFLIFKNFTKKIRQINNNKEKCVKPLDERKIQKYVNYLLKYCQIEYPLSLVDVCTSLIEKSKELQIKNMNPFVKIENLFSFLKYVRNVILITDQNYHL